MSICLCLQALRRGVVPSWVTKRIITFIIDLSPFATTCYAQSLYLELLIHSIYISVFHWESYNSYIENSCTPNHLVFDIHICTLVKQDFNQLFTAWTCCSTQRFDLTLRLCGNDKCIMYNANKNKTNSIDLFCSIWICFLSKKVFCW